MLTYFNHFRLFWTSNEKFDPMSGILYENFYYVTKNIFISEGENKLNQEW